MTCQLTEDDILEGLDANSVEFREHLNDCEDCRRRAAEFTTGLEAIAAAAQPPERAIPARVGPYEVIRRLGEGGMGVVYEARQHRPDRLVALKVIRGGRHVDEYRLRLFEREAQALGRLRHAGIAGVYEAGRDDDGQPYFAMELVHGTPLTTYARENGLPRRERLRLFQRVCDAVTHAHLRGVIHRDLKPSNILVDSAGDPKILDFGLARISDADTSAQTETILGGRIMGTLPYMSPEEARGNRDAVDIRSDLYSLGVVFYELMCDQLPHDLKRAPLPDAVRIICEQPAKRLGIVDRTLAGDIETIAMKAMEKEPTRRYLSVADMREDIERFLTNQPIRARRPNTVYQLRKFVARHPYATLFTVSLLSIVLLTRILVVRIAEESQQKVQGNFDASDFSLAIMQENLARAKYELGALDDAERWYRSCIDTFRRLDRPERAGPAMVDLATVLMEKPREDPTEKEGDYEKAQDFLQQAVDLLEDPTLSAREQLPRALKTLRRLYSAELWDFPEGRAEVDAYLERIRSASDAVPVK